jgi:hypothetical protein
MYDASFYFNPNNPSLVAGSDVTIFTGLDQLGQPLFGVQYNGTDPASGELYAWVMRNGERVETGSVNLDSSAHLIEVAWRGGDEPGFTLYLEGQPVGNLAGDANVLLNMVLLGPSNGVVAGSTAQMYFAQFTSSQIDGTPHFTFLPGIFH